MNIFFDCPLPVWFVGPLAAAILITAIVFLRRDIAHLGRFVRLVLMSLAIIAGLQLIGLVLGPKIIRTWLDPMKPRCVVLADGSRSVLLADTYAGEEEKWLEDHVIPEQNTSNPSAPPNPGTTGGKVKPKYSREKIIRRALARDEDGWLVKLEEKVDVTGVRFSAELEGLPLDAEAAPFEVNKEEGYSTALGEALQLAASGSGGIRPRALILLSDGAWNDGPDPSEVARVLGGQGIPVYVVGVGNPSPPRDASVLSINAPKSVLLGDEVALSVQIATTGMGSRRVPVQLESSGELLEEKQVLTLPSGKPITVNFSFVPSTPAKQYLTVRIPKQVDEEDDSNNKASAVVEVVERKLTVLLIDAEPRWEFRFIRNVLERDRTVTLKICLTRPGIGPIKGAGYVHRLPTERKDLGAYDIIILGDVPVKSLPKAFLTELANMIKLRSGALIVIAGRRGHYRHLVDTPIHEILPVRLNGVRAASRRGGALFRPRLTQAGSSHLITRLAAEDDENELEWASLPEMTWSATVASLVPGAEALLVHPERQAGGARLPLLAVQRVGGGKVMFAGIEETWRWRKVVGDKYHYKFWAQAIRWMAKQPFADGDPRARLSVGRTECSVGESVDIEASCLGPDGFPLDGADVAIRITHESEDSQQLVMEPSGWGIYKTTFTPDRPGAFKIEPIVSAYGEEPLPSMASLDVTRADLERNFLAQDRNMLQSIADASGGKYFHINEIDELAAVIPKKIEPRSLTAEYNPCRHWLYYAILAAALATAWIIRKRSGLA